MAAMSDKCECDVDWESDDNGGGYVVIRCRLCEAKLRLADRTLEAVATSNLTALFQAVDDYHKEIADGKEQDGR